MTEQVRPQTIRLVSWAMASAGVIIIAIGLLLWATIGNGSVPLICWVLWIIGVFELVGSTAFARILGRRAPTPGYDGASATYQEGDRPPGML